MKIIGVIGNRQRDSEKDYEAVRDTVLRVLLPGDWLCSGDCNKGGDRFALRLARAYGWPILLFPPGKVGGNARFFARNDLIAKYSDVLIVCVVRFPGCEESGGTWYTVRKWSALHADRSGLILVE